MDYAKPSDVVASMIDAGVRKLALAPRDLLIRGALSGALLGAAWTPDLASAWVAAYGTLSGFMIGEAYGPAAAAE